MTKPSILVKYAPKGRHLKMTFRCRFAPDGRKVTPRDIERGLQFAAQAFRAYMEGLTPKPYEFDGKLQVEYLYRDTWAGGSWEV